MTRSLSIVMACVLLVAPAGTILGGVTTRLTDDLGASSISVLPGDTFNIVVGLDTTESLVSGQVRIQASDPDLFTLQSAAFEGVRWSVDPADLLNPTPQLLNAANANTSDDIGTVAVDLVYGTGTGIMDFVAIAVSVDPGAPQQTCTLQVVDSVFGNIGFDDVLGTPGPGLEVNIIPEPVAPILALLLLGMIGLVRRSRT